MFLFKHKDPIKDIRWQLYIEDRFDRECPRRVQKAGRGLLKGLKYLWIYQMSEGITVGGRETFNKFNLWCGELDCSYTIEGSRSGLMKLSQWLVKSRKLLPNKKPVLNSRILDNIAEVHYQLIISGENAEKIIQIAEKASDAKSFDKGLESIKKKVMES